MGAQVHVLRYLLQIWWSIPGSWEQKKPILFRLAERVRDFASDHPDAAYADITVRFGTPQQIAEACLENMEPSELAQELKVKRKIVKYIAVGLLTIVLLWGGAVRVAIMEAKNSAGGIVVEEIGIVEQFSITSEGE